jgi:hypothetical protein
MFGQRCAPCGQRARAAHVASLAREFSEAQLCCLLHSVDQRRDVPIRAILEKDAGPVFEPEDVANITAAFDAALSKLD